METLNNSMVEESNREYGRTKTPATRRVPNSGEEETQQYFPI